MSYAYYADGALVPRERFYAFACDPARSAVVEACAGAGKTWMLVSRILRALLAGAAPQEIVAITFTRKAAGEMRERLLEWLAEFAAASEARRVAELIARGMTEAEARAAAPRLAGLQDELLRAGRSVEIRTFHGWFSQLLRAAPLAVLQAEGLSAELQLIEDEAELMPALWRRFHGRVLADTELASAFQCLTETRGRHNLREWLLAAFNKRVELRLAVRAGVLAGSLPDVAEPLAALAPWRPRLAALAVTLGTSSKLTPQKAATALEQALALADAAAFPALWAALFTKTGTAKKGLGDSTAQLDACAALEAIAADIAQHEASIEHARMARLSEVLVAEFEALKRERGLVDMNDLERGALALLSKPELAGWVQQKLDARVRHLLIDEFQDTSPLQWQALHGWLGAYAGAGGGQIAVFIVGDPKQSIYRFRRAEPRVFAAAGDFVRDGLAGVTLACDHTRRNAPEVLAAVNAAFTAQMPGFRPHTTEQGTDAAAGLFTLDGPPLVDAAAEADPDRWRPSLTEARVEAEIARRAPECERVARAIRALLAEGLRPRDVFVLARKRAPLRQMAEALLAAGIPHVAPEDNRLADLPDAQDLIALLDALASPGHALSLARALRSPLFGVDEADLLQLAEAAGTAAWLGAAPREVRERRGWWDALADLAAPSPALARARTLLLAWRAAASRCTPHELLDRIVSEGDLLPRLLAAAPPSEAANRLRTVNALLQAALELDGGRFAELYGFVRALKARSPKLVPAPADDAVQLLTVHGAKGLEAEVVILLDADAAPPRAETLSLACDWPVDAPAPARLAFLVSERRPPPALQSLIEAEQVLREREELNALYVAMTRARRRLIVSRTPPRRGASDASWWARLSPLGRPLTLAEPSDDAPLDMPLPVHLPLPNWTAPPVPARAGAADDAAQANLGEALHRVLEWASAASQTQPLAVLIAASGQAFGLDAAARERLATAADAILQSPDCRPFFDPARLRWAANEVAINAAGDDRRIDRLVQLDDGVWWVLDYKLGATPERETAYLEQMRSYVAAVQKLQPDELVRAALISGTGRLVVVS
ncbi:UvrD-helicase domain-containing protein [Roseateles sp.]|uniref:UvrD-helicase domain-containing protein n=1 Tax=Roseateles sp. TaxID=1971397 RepID=UPI003265A2ED